MSDIKKWVHARKGQITGREVGGDAEWVDIELTEDHDLKPMSRDPLDEGAQGEVIRVRRSFLTEIE